MEKEKITDDLINRQAAIDAFTGVVFLEPAQSAKKYIDGVIERIQNLPSAQPERIIYANMSDEEFEKWLYEHGICNPDIHDSIPCSAVPLLIDNAISEVSSAQPEQRWIPCRERLPENEVRKLVQLDNGWIVAAWWDGKDWYAVPLMYNEFDERCSLGDGGYCVLAWSECPEPYKGES